MSKPYDDLTPQERTAQIKADIKSAFDARDKGDVKAAEVNIVHSYHSGASALELVEAYAAELEARKK